MSELLPQSVTALLEIRRAARAAVALASVRERDPIGMIDWLPAQLRFLQCTAKVKLIRAGMQVLGKSTASLAECIMLATASHPWQPGRHCKDIWIICNTAVQSVVIQKKLWELAPKHLVAPGCKFDDVRGFGGHAPALRIVLPDGRRSTIKIKTAKQRAAALQSATLDHVLIDELVTLDVYRAVSTRVRSTGGTVSLSLTPIDSPADWLRELCEKGQCFDVHAPLHLEQLRHTKSGQLRVLKTPDGPVVCDQAWIDAQRAKASSQTEAIEIDGEWEGRAENPTFGRFDPKRHVATMPVPAGLPLSLGLDHGVDLGKQAAVLVAVDDRISGVRPVVYVLDEYVPDLATTKAQDADAILELLSGCGYGWAELDFAYGDKPAEAAGMKKGNYDIEDEIARRLKLRGGRRELKPRILTVKRGPRAGAHSLPTGVRWVHDATVEPGKLFIHPRCTHLIAAMQKWRGAEHDPHKDVIDALRYALRPWIFGLQAAGTGAPIRVWAPR